MKKLNENFDDYGVHWPEKGSDKEKYYMRERGMKLNKLMQVELRDGNYNFSDERDLERVAAKGLALVFREPYQDGLVIADVKKFCLYNAYVKTLPDMLDCNFELSYEMAEGVIEPRVKCNFSIFLPVVRLGRGEIYERLLNLLKVRLNEEERMKMLFGTDEREAILKKRYKEFEKEIVDEILKSDNVKLLEEEIKHQIEKWVRKVKSI